LAVSGSDLYAGGFFTAAGGITVSNIAKWDGSTWSALGSGMSGGATYPNVSTLTVSGSNLYAAGLCATAGGAAVVSIAWWNGSFWSALGAGRGGGGSYSPNVFALAVSGTNLYAGGLFTTAGGGNANYIAKWNGSSWSSLGSGVSGG